MGKEESIVAASVVLNLYNDAENLLNYAGSYLSTYHEIFAKYNSENPEVLSNEEINTLKELSRAIKVLVYRTYKRMEGISKATETEIPKDAEDGYKELILAQSGRNLTIIYPEDLEKYINGLFEFITNVTIKDLLGVSKGVLKELGI